MEKPPVQARSRATMERLIQVGHQMLAEDSLNLGVTEIARRADCSVGSFYARFSGKRDFLHRLHRELLDEWAELVRDCLSSPSQDLEQDLTQYLESLRAWSEKYRGALNRFSDWAREDSRFGQRQELAEQRAIQALADYLDGRRIESSRDKAEDYFAICWGTVGGRRTGSTDGPQRTRVIKRLARLLAWDAQG